MTCSISIFGLLHTVALAGEVRRNNVVASLQAQL